MKIIIVGPDSAGKTSLVEDMKQHKLFQKYDFEKGSHDTVGKDPIKSLETIKNEVRKNVVYDRWPIIDDLVYSKALDNKDSVLAPYLEDIKEVLKEVVVIYVHAEPNDLIKRITVRGDDFVKASDLENIMWSYESVFEDLGVLPFLINTSKVNIGDTINVVIDKLKTVPQWLGLAHIVPTSGLEYIKNDPFQMSLAHLIDEDQEYFEYYKNKIKEGVFVIMDNGAFEGEDLSNEELLELYYKLKPTELVLKDILFGGEESYKLTKESYEFFRSKNISAKLMGVPQGKSLEEWKENAIRVLELGVDTIGVPRVLDKVQKDGRIEAAKFIRENDLDVEIHLLGAAEDFGETKRVLDAVNIRSMDTSLAHMISKEGLDISFDSKRPKSSIDFKGDFNNAISFIKHKNYMDENMKVEGVLKK